MSEELKGECCVYRFNVTNFLGTARHPSKSRESGMEHGKATENPWKSHDPLPTCFDMTSIENWGSKHPLLHTNQVPRETNKGTQRHGRESLRSLSRQDIPSLALMQCPQLFSCPHRLIFLVINFFFSFCQSSSIQACQICWTSG